MNVTDDFVAYLGTPESGIPSEVRAWLVRNAIDPASVVVVSEPKPFDAEAPPEGRRPHGQLRHPGRLRGWTRALSVRSVPQHAWRRCHVEHWWAWWAPLSAGTNVVDPQARDYAVSGMRTYAYEVGYDRGFSERPVRPHPAECPEHARSSLKAGWADGEWDRRNGHPSRTSFDLSQLRDPDDDPKPRSRP